MFLKEVNKQANNKCFTKAFLLIFLSLFFICFTNTAKASLSCTGVWPYVIYKLEETVSQPDDSTLFNTTIEVKRSETISSIKCTEKIKLGISECKYTDSGFYRYCARLAEPHENGNDYACNTTEAQDNDNDGIYETDGTINCNYDSNGESTGDDECPGCRCNCSQRICAYNDLPGSTISDDFFEPEYGTEGYDNSGTSDDDYRYCCIDPPLTAYYQPYHKNSPNPCCGTNSCSSWWGYDACGDPAATPPDGSKINADADHLGCVDIPLGPYPPPLCDPIRGTTPAAGNMNICTYSPDYELNLTSSVDDSDPDNYKQTSIACDDGSYSCESVCEFSTATGNPADAAVYSTFEKPLVRIYFDNTLPLCASDYVIPRETPENDTCVQFLDSDLTSEEIWKDKKNLIPVCDSGSTGPDCFSFPSKRDTGPSGSSDTFGTEYKYFKTYYNVFGSDVVSESKTMPYANYSYGDDYSTTTVSLAGLYDSYYEDMTDNFNMSTDPEDAYTANIVDYTSKNRKFLSYLNLSEEDDDGMTLCVYEDIETEDNLNTIVCVPRPKMFPPTVYPCLNGSDCKYPSNIIPYEQPRIDFDVGDPPQSGIIGIDIPDNSATQAFCVIDDYHTTAATESNTTDGDDRNTDPCTVYKAKIFSAYLTDDDNYETTSDDDGTVTPYGDTETYQGGMQYVNNVYCRGATKICLRGYSSPKVVISKIIPLVVDGETMNVASNLISDRVIPPPPEDGEEESYPLSDDILYNSVDNDWYSSSSQPITTTYFGYLSEDPNAPADTYIAKSYCNSGNESSADYIICSANDPDNIPDIATDTPSDDISCTCSNETGVVTDDCSTSADPDCEPTYSDGSYSCTNDQCQFVWKETTTSDTNTLAGYQYTDSSGTLHQYPIDSYMKRNLNAMELAQCVDAAQPFCDAVTGLTSSSASAADNGYANWPQTYVDNETEYVECVEGRQPRQDNNGNDIIPTRWCRYTDQYDNDGYAILKENGCPEYTIDFESVENGCVKASIPDWWPSQFLTNKPSLQGAIFNQFNIALDYQGLFDAVGANYNPYVDNNINLNPDYDSTWIEDWYTTNDYNSCKRYGSSRTTSNTKRELENGDQEMLHLTQDNWESLWNDNDLTWLLVDDSNNNTCGVYNLGKKVNVTNGTKDRIDQGRLTVAMKICKYNNKISFSLVDLAYNSATDYTNIAYIMQSNIIAYDAYTTQNVTDNVSNEGGFVPKTTITNNDLPNRKSKYHTYINHGIVVDKDGFDPFETDLVVPGPPPNDPIEIAEKIETSFYFAGVYNWKTSYKDSWGNTKHRDYAKYSFSSPASCGSGDDKSYEDSRYNDQKNTDLYPSCALSQYRGSINYSNPDSSSREDISKYLPGPTDIDPLNLTSQQGESANQGGNYSYISRQYWNSCYDGNNMDDSWPYQDGCIQEITIGEDRVGVRNSQISGFTKGNSAMNENMFLWRSAKSYDVCNN